MENFERLSSKILVRTCSCGIIFETYDPEKVYHSNKCRTRFVRKRCEAKIAQRMKPKQKKLREQNFM